jgi:phosphatidylglycerophosphate synthase
LVTWDQYAAVWASLHGGADPRRARPSVRRWLVVGFRIASVCARLRIRPGAVTAVGLLACVAVPLAARHAALLAALLVIVSALTDTVDGALAVLTDRTTRLGYVYDAMVDRLSEAAWLVGFWLLGVPGVVVVAAGGVSWLHEYARARANAAGMTEIGTVTAGERPTRVILAGLGFGLAGLVAPMSRVFSASLATFAVAVWVVFAVIGFAQLFGGVHRALAGRAWPSWRPAGASLASVVGPKSDVIAPKGGVVAPQSAMSIARDVPAPDVDGVDADLAAELAMLVELPGSSTVYASRHATDESLGRHGRVEADRVPADGTVAADGVPPRHADPQ